MTPKIFGIQSNLSSKLLELETLNLVHSFHLEKPIGRANNFPQKGRGLGHVTPQFLAYNRTYLQNYLSYSLQTSNLVNRFAWGKPSGRSNSFPQKGRRLGHVTPKLFGTQ